MISVERALDSINGKSTEEVRQFARDRILGIDIASFGSGHSNEPTEDVVIQLLANPQLDADNRKAVVEAWIDVYRQVRNWLDDLDKVDDIKNCKDVIVNLCRVVDIAEPPEFKKFVKLLITQLLEEESSPAELLGAAVKAYMAYAQDDKSIRFWEDEVLTNKDVAAYAFNALLDIDAGHPRIEEHLCQLWRLQAKENWSVNTAFLLRRAARVRDEIALIYRVLLKLKNKDYSVWKIIEEELKQQSWTKQWLADLAKFESPEKDVYKIIQESIVKSMAVYADLPSVTFEHGLGAGSVSVYCGALTIRSHPSNIDWVDDIGRIAQLMNYEGRVNPSPRVKKEHKEIAHATKVG